jgi:hypothetical protein
MFFEPLPTGEVTAAGGFHLPERPLWSGPPELETGAILAVLMGKTEGGPAPDFVSAL